MAVLPIIGVLLFAFHCAFATEHIVGGTQGWLLGPDYGTWAKRQAFKVGDTLKFVFNNGTDDVIELGSQTAFDQCSFTGGSIVKSPAVFHLSEKKTYYFICTYEGHCQGGEKFSIKVPQNATKIPPPPPPPPSPPPPSPKAPPASADSESPAESPTSDKSGAIAGAQLAFFLLAAPLVFLVAFFD